MWAIPKTSLCFSSLATQKTQYNYRPTGNTQFIPLAPRQSVTEFITQSNTVFPPAEVSCHSFLRCFCVAQHTWGDDSPVRLNWRFQHTTGQQRVKVSFHIKPWKIPVQDSRNHCLDVILGSDFWPFFFQCQVCADLISILIYLCTVFPGTAFRDWTGGRWRYRRAPDVLYSYLPKRDCPLWSKTLFQYQTWRDGQLFCTNSL